VLSYFEVALDVRLRFVSVPGGCRLEYVDEGKKALLIIGDED
jgi:hypothetical protein